MKIVLFIVTSLCFIFEGYGQKMRFWNSDELNFQQIPLKPMPGNFQTYAIEVDSDDEIAKLMAIEKQYDEFLMIGGYERITSGYPDFTITLHLGNFEFASKELQSRKVTRNEKEVKELFYAILVMFPAEIIFTGKTNEILSREVINPDEPLLAGWWGQHNDKDKLSVDFEVSQDYILTEKESVLLDEALRKTKEMVENEYAYLPLKIKSTLISFKSTKKEDYSDFDNINAQVIETLENGLGSSDQVLQTEELDKAVVFWNDKMRSADPKKDKNIIKACNYNIAVVSMWLGDYDMAWDYITNTEEPAVESSYVGFGHHRREVLQDIENRKKRFEANQKLEK